ncbi:O-antigen ligase family protein [Sphaerobacter thermophilus]|uniref:O-antigen ligase family protein n=1 Tax=Sphaerobacter thermophilus TaxID=2057 RepID=UPI0039C0CD1A
MKATRASELGQAAERRYPVPSWGASAVAALAVAGLYAKPPMPVVAALLSVAVGVAAIHPPGVLASIAAALALIDVPVPFGALRFNPAEVLLVAALGGIALRAGFALLRSGIPAVRYAMGRARTLALTGFGPVAIALLVVGTLSLFTVADPSHRAESLREYRWVILEPVVFAFLLRWYLTDRSDRWLTAWLYAGAAALAAMYAVVAGLGGSGLAVEGVVRISGTYPHPNALGLYLERVVPFAVALGIAFRSRLDLRWLALAALCAAGLLLTFSRGAYLGAGAGLLVVAWLAGRRRMAGALVLGAVVLGGALVLVAGERLLSLFSGGSGSLRLAIWQSSLAMIRDHPITGVGLDQFLYQYAPRYVLPEAWPERFTSHPHNFVLDLWLRLGIMGLGVAAAYAVVLVRRVHRIVGQQSRLGLGALGALVAGATHGLVDNGYFLPGLALAFWLVTAIIDLEVGRTGGDTG